MYDGGGNSLKMLSANVPLEEAGVKKRLPKKGEEKRI